MPSGGDGYQLPLWYKLWNVSGAPPLPTGPAQTHFFCMGEGAGYGTGPGADSGASLELGEQWLLCHRRSNTHTIGSFILEYSGFLLPTTHYNNYFIALERILSRKVA